MKLNIDKFKQFDAIENGQSLEIVAVGSKRWMQVLS